MHRTYLFPPKCLSTLGSGLRHLGATGILAALLVSPACVAGEDADRPAGDPSGSDRPVVYDWLISGGEVIDGTGADRVRADVLVRDGRIAYIGTVDADTLEVLAVFDASGRVVTPGFIDTHSHGDPLETPAFENFLAQGVTTIVLGQDGSSPPAGELAAHLEAIEALGPSVNVAYLIGHNTVRGESGVGFDAPSPDGRTAMASLVTTALDAGAFGLSLGLEYTPGQLADMEELVAIAEPVAARNGVVMSHMRTEDAGEVLGAVEELLEQGRRSGARVHASHLKVVLGNDPNEARTILAAMDQARSEGRGVTGEVYPYLASFTGIAILFPDWARPPNDYDAVKAERREELARHLRDRVMSRNGPEATLFGTGPWPGSTLAQVAEREGQAFEEILIELGPGGARAAYFVMDEEVMREFLLDPYVTIASDGSPVMGHPRGYGSFTRVITRHVANESLLDLEEAIRKMTSLPASILGLDDPERVGVPRGTIRPGWSADLLVFDPRELVERADFENPHRLSEGMRAVWVGGEPSWWGDELADPAGGGTVLRSTGGRAGSHPDEGRENPK